MSQQPTNPRTVALSILEQVILKNGYSNLALDHTLKQSHLDARDRHLVTTLVYGVIQHQLTLEWQLAPFLAGKKLAPWYKLLLEMALYQLLYLDKVPDHAVLNEATELAKRRGHVGLAKLTTGVLRAVQRQGVRQPAEIEDPIERISIQASVPRWLVEKIVAQQGLAKAKTIFASINQPAAASLRVNTAKTTAAQLQAQLAAEFASIRESAITPAGLVADSGHLAGTAAFDQGLYTMQDESSMLVAPSLNLEPSSRVLDACAAPGGKTTHIAQFLAAEAGGSVTALDLHPHKVRLIEANAKRLGLESVVQTAAMDARTVGAHFAPESFDRILVDAPCSGLGLIRRKPEIKYAKQAADLLSLQQIQLAILEAVAPLLKAGGQMTYSTCTIVEEENQAVVAQFLSRHPEFTQQPVTTLKPLDEAHGAPALQLFPDDYGTDGFFIASLVRTGR